MSLAHILYPAPTDDGLVEWGWQHYQHHLSILSGLKTSKGISGTLYRIYPVNFDDMRSWAYQHQLQHNDFNQALDLGGNDITKLDYKDQRQFDAWLYQHFTEHQAAAERLKLA